MYLECSRDLSREKKCIKKKIKKEKKKKRNRDFTFSSSSDLQGTISEIH